jgi:hypothetical protein
MNFALQAAAIEPGSAVTVAAEPSMGNSAVSQK